MRAQKSLNVTEQEENAFIYQSCISNRHIIFLIISCNIHLNNVYPEQKTHFTLDLPTYLVNTSKHWCLFEKLTYTCFAHMVIKQGDSESM